MVKWMQRILVAALAFSLGFIPLIARFYLDQNLSPQFRIFGFGDWWGDLFFRCKDQAIIICGVFAVAVASKDFFFNCEKPLRGPLIILGVLGGVILLSWVSSPYRDIGLWGAPGTYGGVLVHLGYLGLAAAAATVPLRDKIINFLVLVLGFSLVFVSILGLPEVFGIHPLMNDLAVEYLLGIDSHSGFHMSRSRHQNATAMFGHSNYMGTYGAMMGPFFLAFALNSPSQLLRRACWVFTILAWSLLVGSFSRTGYLAGTIAVFTLGALWYTQHKGLGLTRRKTRRAFLSLIVIALTIGLVCRFIPRHENRLIARIQSIWQTNGSTKRPQSFLALEKDTLNVELAGYRLRLQKDVSGNIELKTPDNLQLPPDDGGIQLDKGFLNGYPLVDIKKDGLGLKAALTPHGFRVLSHRSLLKPENPAQYLRFIDDEFINRRGFIWKRTLPIILNAPWLGYGPGSFILTYPNRDFTGFLNTFGSTDTLIDKPHNFYLQFAHSFGLPALGLFLLIFGTSITRSLIIFLKKHPLKSTLFSPTKGTDQRGGTILNASLAPTMTHSDSFRAACLVSLIGFAVSGLANDSMSGVSLIAWIFMGFCLSGEEKK
jgi:O-antigen ligase